MFFSSRIDADATFNKDLTLFFKYCIAFFLHNHTFVLQIIYFVIFCSFSLDKVKELGKPQKNYLNGRRIFFV